MCRHTVRFIHNFKYIIVVSREDKTRNQRGKKKFFFFLCFILSVKIDLLLFQEIKEYINFNNQQNSSKNNNHRKTRFLFVFILCAPCIKLIKPQTNNNNKKKERRKKKFKWTKRAALINRKWVELTDYKYKKATNIIV